jgi:pSer/pThr/pTyr-binding forkhead associated (FHA) protein
MPEEAYGLNFISGKYRGGQFPLPADREIVIGRAGELDMVLEEDMVSRRHAKITTTDGQIVISDLGSTNGTFVNGEKVTKTRLKEDDRILIGTSILKVMRFSADSTLSTETAKERLAAVRSQDTKPSTMSGTLEEVPIPDLVQLFITSKRSGVLKSNHDGQEGRIYLRNGEIFFATIDDREELGPKKSICRMVGWDRGSFEFAPIEQDPGFIVELAEPTETLLMDAIRQLDEFRRIAPSLPDGSVVLRIAKPLTQPIADLDTHSLQVLQAVHNHGRINAILDHAPSTDLDTATHLVELVSGGYVTLESGD